nr:tyrosine-protein kinase-like otk isoform X2 [Onthophagus taurus]
MCAFWELAFGLIVSAVVVAASEDELYFSKHPEDHEVVSGRSVTLFCETKPTEGISYYWELNGSKIANTTRRHQQGSNLHITRVDRERDSGQFRCNAQGPSGVSTTSNPAKLNIHWIEEPSVQLQSPESASFITNGGEVVLRCHLEASGDVHVEWFRNSDRLVKSSKHEMKKRRLHIKEASPSDNGIYKCTAQNQAGIKHSTKNFALAVAGNQTALIEKVPTNQLVKKGETVFFHCSYQQADVIEWYFKDVGPLESNNRVTLHKNGTLQIDNVQHSDQGLYTCVGVKSESDEVPQNYNAELHIAYIHDFVPSYFEPTLNEDATYIVPEGSEFQLTCLEPKSMPPAKKWWQSPAGHTVSDKGQVKVDDDGRLIIEKVELSNAGNYTCVAENIADIVQQSINLIITTKPKIITHPNSVTVDENENSLLICNFETESEEYTTVRWRKDGKPFNHDFEEGSANPQRIKIFKHNGTLLIQSTKISDRGEYVCEVITTGFKPVLSNSATISVIEILKFAPPPVNKKLELGTVAKIHCKAQGTPPPIIHWEKIGSNSEGFANHIADMNGTLHFNGVLVEDKGKYTCTASNSQGIINATVTIDVVVAPKFSILPKTPTEAIEGTSVWIDCVVEGDPKPTIQWDKNSKMNDFDNARFKVLKNGTLYITEVHREDDNSYGCTAGSSAGLNRKEVRLIVHGRDHQNENANEGSAVTKAVLITMSVAAAYIILVVGLMVWCRYRRRSRKLPINDTKTENGDIDHAELKENANGHTPGPSKITIDGESTLKEGQKSDGAETTHSQGSNQSKKSKSSYDKFALSRTHLKETKLIGRGEFGDIMVAKISKSVIGSTSDKRNSGSSTPNGVNDEKDVHVLVKSLSHTKDEHSLTEFKREIDMFTKLTHDNVTKLFGLCREAEPHYMILEHTDWGDLKQFLVATQKGEPPQLTPVQCVAIIQQLARGMDHLASSRMIHKDLAARNCVITSKLVAKIGIPRTTRDPYSMEYCKHMNHIIPLRWMPYEAVYEDEFSTKSDVYAFGVVIWEIFYQGELPFPKMNDNSLLTKLKEKALEWKFHKDTPEELQKLQETCLDTNPQNRPTFASMVKEIEEILKSM